MGWIHAAALLAGWFLPVWTEPHLCWLWMSFPSMAQAHLRRFAPVDAVADLFSWGPHVAGSSPLSDFHSHVTSLKRSSWLLLQVTLLPHTCGTCLFSSWHSPPMTWSWWLVYKFFFSASQICPVSCHDPVLRQCTTAGVKQMPPIFIERICYTFPGKARAKKCTTKVLYLTWSSQASSICITRM
jgi:hypothetical protein